MLFNLAFPSGLNDSSLIEPPIPKEEIKYFTDLLRTFQLPASLPARGDVLVFLKYSATQLHDAGVKFKKATTRSILDLDFKNGELKIPTLTFEDGMEDLVRNIMALEQCNIRLDAYFTDFYIILDHLINTTKDVDLLSEKGIIVNCLGYSEAVTSMTNKLNRGIKGRGMNANYFNLCENLNAFAEGFWNRTKAKLIRQYFNSPWKGTATIAAFIILALTLLQTIFTIKSSIGPKRV